MNEKPPARTPPTVSMMGFGVTAVDGISDNECACRLVANKTPYPALAGFPRTYRSSHDWTKAANGRAEHARKSVICASPFDVRR